MKAALCEGDEGVGMLAGTGASDSARSMSYGMTRVLGPVECRRRFSVEQKLAVVAEASAPGTSISEIARRHELQPSQVFKWRRLAEFG